MTKDLRLMNHRSDGTSPYQPMIDPANVLAQHWNDALPVSVNVENISWWLRQKPFDEAPRSDLKGNDGGVANN